MQLTIQQKLKTKLFKDVIKLLNKAKVPFWLDFDTLLGVWSTKIGKDLSRERNIYISIEEKHLQTAYSFKVVISIKYRHNNEFRWIDIRNCKHITEKYYSKLDEIESGGNTYNIPSETDEYLNYRYCNWKSIPENWMHQIDDGTLASDDLIQSVPIQAIERKITKENIKLVDSNNHNRMKKMLLFTIDQLQKHNIPFWLEAGTLLGIYRDGDLIPWDYDSDISIPAEYVDKVATLRYKFFPSYIIRKRPIINRWIPGDTRVVKIKTTWEKLLQVNFHIDLFCVYKVNNKYRWVDSGVLKEVDAKFFDTQDYINWEGRKIAIPAHTEEYLSLRYGNWQIPSKSYIAGLHDGAIVERGF
jgi:phosphorylcholine metabolism protein LicD